VSVSPCPRCVPLCPGTRPNPQVAGVSPCPRPYSGTRDTPPAIGPSVSPNQDSERNQHMTIETGDR
jgi:hypothetical protein